MGVSGTTPTLIGTCSQKSVEQVVAVIDRSHPMNLILVWKDSIPLGWEALKGRPLRIAAVQPITFNTETPAMDVSPDENSVVVQDNSILLVRYNRINPAADVFRPGLEKWTWIPSLRQLCRNWLNTSTYLPNAMQALSTSVGYFYSIGEKLIGKEKYWTFEGNDWLTGESKIQKVLGPHHNSAYNTYAAGISFGPNGEVITMSREMIFIFKKINKN